MSEPSDELRDLLAAAAEEHTLAGISAGVVADGQAHLACHGTTDVKAPRDVDADTAFAIGSTSKTFTATALMALVEQGKVALTDRVADHLPGFTLLDEEVAASVTVQQLFNHTGGWRGDLLVDSGWGDNALDLAMTAIADSPQELPPGTLPSYSNSGFIVAGRLVAEVAGTSFEQAVRDLVLAPLGLTTSAYFPWEIAHRPHAVGHIVRSDRAESVPIFPMQRWLGPAGGLWSSLRDQVAYLRFHLDGTVPEGATAPITEESRLLMQQPSIEARSGIDGIGVSWLLKHHGDVRLVTHGGNVSNVQTSAFDMAPDLGVGVTVMTNGKQGLAVGATVLAWALDRFCGIGTPAPLTTVPSDVDGLAGTYDLGVFKVVLTEASGTLSVDLKVPDTVPEEVRIAFASVPRELVAVAPDVFALASSPTAAVLDVRRDSTGAVKGVMHGMRFAPRIS